MAGRWWWWWKRWISEAVWDAEISRVAGYVLLDMEGKGLNGRSRFVERL